MFMRIVLCTFFWMLFFSSHTFAQSKLYHPAAVSETVDLKEGDLYLSVANKHFFINNEYSAPVVYGYTLPGQTISPLLKYLTRNGHLQLETGLQLKHFFGQRDPISIHPIFTAELKVTPTTQFIMGALRGNLNHEASDLLFKNEYRYTRKPEYGVQIRHNSKRLWMDFWLNWEKYIVHGDTIPEQFTAGLSLQVPLLSSTSGWKITSPLQMIIVHRGGEISSFKENGRSDMNNLVGLEIEKSSNAFITRWGVFGNYLNYYEMKSISNNAFTKGEGVETGAFIQKQSHHLRASWWKGHKYIAHRGNPIYQSVSDYNDELTFRNRYLLAGKYAFKKEFSKDFVFSILVEGYYDLKLNYLDYSYGFQLLYVPQFFLKNLSPSS